MISYLNKEQAMLLYDKLVAKFNLLPFPFSAIKCAFYRINKESVKETKIEVNDSLFEIRSKVDDLLGI
jgi:hypothetical protein